MSCKHKTLEIITDELVMAKEPKWTFKLVVYNKLKMPWQNENFPRQTTVYTKHNMKNK